MCRLKPYGGGNAKIVDLAKIRGLGRVGSKIWLIFQMSTTCGLYPSKHKVKVIMNINISRFQCEGRGWFLLSIEMGINYQSLTPHFLHLIAIFIT
jgi:hypothetical protein